MDYQVRHHSYSSAVSCALMTNRKNYIISDNQVFNEITTQPRPRDGETKRISLSLFKDTSELKTKELEEMLHIQIYNDGSMYELNMYIL